MSMLIEVEIPYDKFSVIKDGKLIKNLVGFEFEASMNKLPILKLKYGDTYHDIDDKINSRIAALQLTNEIQNVKIEINSTSSKDIFVYIDGKKEDYVQSIKINADMYKENKLEITHIVGV